MRKPANRIAAQISATTCGKLQLLHVVRRYGPVGGMERYVWELTMQLQKLGHHVTVVCERCHTEKPKGITVIELGEVTPRPRWFAALRFDRRLVHWLNANPQSGRLIHSHERISSHDITTFHSSPFATIFEKPWWRMISLRVVMQLFLERRELENARCIVPNSHIIKQQLTHYYPEFAHKLAEPIAPGVVTDASLIMHNIPRDGGVIGFVGKEWKRKGLARAVEVVRQLRLARPKIQFVVVGPAPKEIQHLFVDWQDGYDLKGWRGHTGYTDFDVLLHPAKAEAYGMVICEAMAARVPVVLSDICGAAPDVTSSAGNILPLSAPIDDWVYAIERQLNRTEPAPQFERSWRKVAQEYERKWRSLNASQNLGERTEFALKGISYTH